MRSAHSPQDLCQIPRPWIHVLRHDGTNDLMTNTYELIESHVYEEK